MGLPPSLAQLLAMTVDQASGEIGFDFQGKVRAEGLDLASAPGLIALLNQVRWLRSTDGALIAHLTGIHNPDPQGATHEGVLQIASHSNGDYTAWQLFAMDDAASNFGIQLRGERNPGSSPKGRVFVQMDDDPVGNILTATLLDGLGGSSFMRVLDEQILGVAGVFDFQGINQAGAHLMIEVYARGTGAVTSNGMRCQFNGDTGANYDWAFTRVFGATFSPVELFGQTFIEFCGAPAGTAPANEFGHATIRIGDYARTVGKKTLIAQGGFKRGVAAGDIFTYNSFASWQSTAAINRVRIFPNSGNWVAGSRATLYSLGAS